MSLHLSAEKHMKVLEGCRFCGMCTHVCTVGNATHNDANAPRGKGRLLYALHTGMMDFTPRVAELLYQCADCKLCQAWCVPGLDIGATIRDARRDVVERDAAPATASAVSRATAGSGNPYGKPTPVFDWIDKSAIGAKGAQVLYFVDSHTAYNEPSVAQATWHLFERLQIRAAVLPQWIDSGESLLELGYLEQARAQAEKTLLALREAQAESIVFSSADAYHMVAKEYSETFGLSTEGLQFCHISEFLAEHLKSQQLTRFESRVTWHDPCRLGRGMNVYDAPRMVLTQIPGLVVIEPYRTREKAVCCGAGGGLAFTNPAIANDAARQAGHMLGMSNPQMIATGCSRCKSSLQPVLAHVEVVELAELVARVLA